MNKETKVKIVPVIWNNKILALAMDGCTEIIVN